MDDIMLIKRCLNGDDDAFAWLFQKYHGLVYHWAWQRLGNHADAQDVAQEVFSRAYANLSQLSDFTKFRSWLYRIVVNCCNDWFRERRHSLVYQLHLEDDIDYIEEAWMRAGESEARLMVHDAVECLNEEHRRTVRMYYWDNYTCREISRILGVSVGTVTSRLTRARVQLRKELGWMTSTGKRTKKIITGYLFGPDGHPIAFADVALREFGGDVKTLKETTTTGNGKFIFQGKIPQYPKLLYISPQIPDTFTMANFNIVRDNFKPITIYVHRPLRDIGKRYVAGRILEEDGVTPLRNAEFTMFYYCPTSNARPGGSEANITLATDENGRYQHQLSSSVRHSESFCFIILHNGHSAKRIVKIPYVGGRAVDDLDFVLKPRRLSIRGRCVNAVDGSIEEDTKLKEHETRFLSKTLIKDVPIYIIGEGYNILQQSLTDDEGYFEFCDVPPGVYRLSVDPWGKYASTRVRITEENTPVYVEVLRVPCARASGMVTSSKDGKPIYAQVRWSGNIWHCHGRYENLIVGPGHADIYASAGAHKTIKRRIFALPGQHFENLDFVLPYEGYASATGIVDVGAVSGKITRADGSPPPPDTIVIFTPYLSAKYTEHDKTQVAPCDEHGKFHVTHLTAGDYVMVAVAKDFPMTFRFVCVDTAQTLEGLDLQLQHGGSVEGKFIVPNGNPAPKELRVILVPQPTSEHEKLPHWVPLKERTPPIVDIVEGAFGDGISCRPDPVNQYVNEYCTEISNLEREGSAIAADFRIEQIFPGKYDVAVQALNHRIEIPIRTIEIKPNEITQLELVMPRYGSLGGRVLDAQTGKPVECAEIAVESAHQLQTPGVYTDTDGYYHVDTLLPGKFRLRSSSHNRLPRVVDGVDVREGERTEVADIKLLEGAYIDGMVNESETLSLSDRQLSVVLEKESEERGRKKVSWDGKFFFDNLPPGAYKLKLIDDTESAIAEKQVEIACGGEVTIALRTPCEAYLN